MLLNTNSSKIRKGIAFYTVAVGVCKCVSVVVARGKVLFVMTDYLSLLWHNLLFVNDDISTSWRMNGFDQDGVSL